MLADGADIIDIGGESTRPGAKPVSVDQELQRVIPIVEAVTSRFDTIVSVDTSTAQVIKEAAAAGASLINDVRALRREGALQAAADCGLPVCLMHMQNQPDSMQQNPHYLDVVAEVIEFLQQRKQTCLAAGISAEQILLDPGFGFGKTLEHNLALFNGLGQLAGEGHPVLVGVSRKSMIGQILNSQVDNRIIGSVTMALLAAQQVTAARGSLILRVHDVKETVQALSVWQHSSNKEIKQ
jgi:dihydropteroate synthase